METIISNAVATGIENSVEGYDLGQKLIDLINAQIYRLLVNKTFVPEAEYIKKTCEMGNLNTIVDFGCWTGVLATEVFNTGLTLQNYHLIDAVPYYLEVAKLALSGKTFTHESVTLLPPNFNEPEPKVMLIHPYDTLNSSSIYSRRFLGEKIKAANVTLKMAPCMQVADFVKLRPELFQSNCYVKIDLDGVDIALVRAILDGGYFPGAIHFEVWGAVKGSYSELTQRLDKAGYKVPAINLLPHQSFSATVSKNWWWAVGYDDITTNPKLTYYSMDQDL